MRRLITLLCVSANIYSGLALSNSVVSIGGRVFIGDARSLSTVSKVFVGDYATQAYRWHRAQGMNEVLPILSTQLPTNTIALGEDNKIRFIWTTDEQSFVLQVLPVGFQQVSFLLTIIDLTALGSSRAKSVCEDLKKILSDTSLHALLMMESRDESAQSEALTLLYKSTLPVHFLFKKIKELLYKNDWRVTHMLIPHQFFMKEFSLEATRLGLRLRVDVVDNGHSFMFVNLNGGHTQ